MQNADHWVFEQTGLLDGDIVGAPDHLVGYECDGTYYPRGATLAVPDGSDATPNDFLILGFAEIPNGWGGYPNERAIAPGPTSNAATMGLYTSSGGGIVFTAATTDWVRVLLKTQ